MNVPPILTFDGVSKSYRQASGSVLHALQRVTLRVAAGRKVAITGRSGSGKSTLLHLAAGIDVPSEGSVSFLGRNLALLSERERTLQRRETIGLVFQFFHLLPHLTVRENVVLPGWIAGDLASESDDRANDLLDRVGLRARAGDLVDKLSGGEMQRVAICRALLRRPRLMLADEPTGNLDDENAVTVMGLLIRLVEEEQSTLVYVTHSLELAGLADETWRLHSGILEPS
ncbi:MAG: ABC transporter ATP-binding protein [Vicinamibacteria bacterium]